MTTRFTAACGPIVDPLAAPLRGLAPMLDGVAGFAAWPLSQRAPVARVAVAAQPGASLVVNADAR